MSHDEHAQHTIGTGHLGADHVPVLMISCDTCVMQGSDACDDCMMNSLCGNDNGAVILSLQELREVRMLARAGLVPTLRHRAVG